MLSITLRPISRVIPFPRAIIKPRPSPKVCQSYRERFTDMNKADLELDFADNKKELENFYGFLANTNQLSKFDASILDTFDENFVEEMHYVFVLYTKPLSARRRIALRDIMLPYLEKADEPQAKFLEELLKYYECL